jgi:hypothetical protein
VVTRDVEPALVACADDGTAEGASFLAVSSVAVLAE